MAVDTTVNITIAAILSGTAGDGGSKPIRLAMEIATQWLTGTSALKGDKVYAARTSLAASPLALDLRGGVTDEYGATVSMVEIILVALRNKSTTTGQVLTVTSTIPWISGNVVLGPYGWVIWASPYDGVAVTAGTGDTVTLDPGASSFDIEGLVIGRSA